MQNANKWVGLFYLLFTLKQFRQPVTSELNCGFFKRSFFRGNENFSFERWNRCLGLVDQESPTSTDMMDLLEANARPSSRRSDDSGLAWSTRSSSRESTPNDLKLDLSSSSSVSSSVGSSPTSPFPKWVHKLQFQFRYPMQFDWLVYKSECRPVTNKILHGIK